MNLQTLMTFVGNVLAATLCQICMVLGLMQLNEHRHLSDSLRGHFVIFVLFQKKRETYTDMFTPIR